LCVYPSRLNLHLVNSMARLAFGSIWARLRRRARALTHYIFASWPMATVALAVALVPNLGAAAETYPDRPIQLVVPYAPGGATDTVARLLQEGIQQQLGEPLLVVNRPGGNTIVGTEYVAHAKPDGYTIGMVSVPHVANFTLFRHMPYSQGDFAPIARVTNTPGILVVNPSLPVKSLADFIAYIKARPGTINYGTFGVGSSAHLAALLFESKIGQKLTAVHYHGGAPAAIAVMTGEIQFEFGTPLSVKGGIDSGKLKPLAVSSKNRLPFLPNVPTMTEAGLDFVSGAWFGLLAPAGTPQPIVNKLYGAVKKAMTEPKVVSILGQSGTEIVVTSPAEFGEFITDETKAWHKILSGISIEKQ
jgi:tripartite-type tricarboxylate transporter receptor subunit TctC